MAWKQTDLQGAMIFEPNVFGDERGYFVETYNSKTFAESGLGDISFVQDNEAYSRKGVLRGLHFQRGEHAQAKLVRAVTGEILDVIVDLRKGSKTYGQSLTVLLTGENKVQLFVPRGFAHGYIVLSDEAIFSYKCDNFYNKESEGGLIFNDPDINVDWILTEDQFVISQKDLILPKLSELSNLGF